MTPKELVILAAQIDLPGCCWSVGSIDAAAHIDPLVQSPLDDIVRYKPVSTEERISFLRHRIAGALQKGTDRLWGRERKAELIAIEFATADAAEEVELVSRVAEHFCVWMVRPPVICLHVKAGAASSVLASNTDSADLNRIRTGLAAMRLLTKQSRRRDSQLGTTPQAGHP